MLTGSANQTQGGTHSQRSKGLWQQGHLTGQWARTRSDPASRHLAQTSQTAAPLTHLHDWAGLDIGVVGAPAVHNVVVIPADPNSNAHSLG